MIDWKEIAERNGMTPRMFKLEIFTVAAALGAMELDEKEHKCDCIKFTSSDEVGKLELYIRRVEE